MYEPRSALTGDDVEDIRFAKRGSERHAAASANLDIGGCFSVLRKDNEESSPMGNNA